MPILRSAKCLLRPLRSEDAQTTLEWRQDVATRGSILGYRMPVTLELESAWLGTLMTESGKSRASFAIEETGVNKLAGMVHLMDIDLFVRSAEIGIVLGPEARGKGIGSEAARLLIRFGFDTLNLQRIMARYLVRNAPAKGLFRGLNFGVEGVLRRAAYEDGQYLDVELASLLREGS